MTRRELRLVATVAASALATPALGQMDHSKMHMPGMVMPAPKPAPALKKAAPAKVSPRKATKAAPKPAPARKATRKKATTNKAAPVNPVHDMSAMPAPGAAAADPHAGHHMADMPTAAPSGTDLAAGNAPPPPIPTDHAADAIYGAEAMAMGRHHLMTMHGGQKFSRTMLNLAEYQARHGRSGYQWEGESWFGGDIDRLVIKSKGDGTIGRSVGKAEVQALVSHAIGPYFNVQGGLRYDARPDPSRAYAVIGFEGLAPRFFEVEGALFLSSKGELTARAEGYYDQRITQRLILQPRIEVNLAAQNSRDIGVGAGLGEAEAGLRLRYEIRREFAPYVGVQYSRAFGRTADYRRDAGEGRGGLGLVAGVRMWF